jgi:intracellular septation protein
LVRFYLLGIISNILDLIKNDFEKSSAGLLFKMKNFKSLLLAGILPVVAFTVIEEYMGTLAGLIAGMIFGVGEILWELKTQGKVEPMTWAGNGMIFVLGGVSLITQEGVWFKLQPAILEFGMTAFLWGSVLINKPFLLIMFQKQGGVPPRISERPDADRLLHALSQAFRGLTIRLGLFFAVHAVLAIWASLYWSTAAWAILKGVVFTTSLILYLVVEGLLLRRSLGFLRNTTPLNENLIRPSTHHQ